MSRLSEIDQINYFYAIIARILKYRKMLNIYYQFTFSSMR